MENVITSNIERCPGGLRVKTDKMFTPLSEAIQGVLEECEAKDGIVHIFSKHTTACIKILENEVLSLMDIKQHLEKQASESVNYLHDNIDLREVPPEERINGVSHVRSLYFGHSETIPVFNGKLDLGEWQEIFLIELDPSRERMVVLSYLGI